MRMATDEFVDQVLADRIKIKHPTLAGQLRVEHHLKQQIAQLLGHLHIIASLDGVHQFIHLLHRMGAKGTVVLLAIPGASVGSAQRGHHLQELSDGSKASGRGFGHGIVFEGLSLQSTTRSSR